MDILYIGYLLNENLYSSNPATSTSAGIFEEGLLYEIKHQLKKGTLTILTITPNDYYPKGKLYSQKTCDTTKRGLRYSTVQYLNVPILRQQTIYSNLKHGIKKWIKNSKSDRKVILFYNLGTPIVQSIYAFRNKVDCFYSIVCDFFFTQKRENIVTSVFHKFTDSVQKKYISRCSGIILLNRCLAEDYKLKNYLVMEGAISDSMISLNPKYKKNDNIISIRYVGALDELHGSKVLIKLGAILKKQFPGSELLVAGRGNMQNEVANSSKNDDTAMHYVGVLTREEANAFIAAADILLIPHQLCFQQLRYQFSSKMFDYMASMKPVIVSPMPGLPSEYKEMVFVSSGDDADSIMNSINYVCSLDHDVLIDRLTKAQDYVINNRTWKKQAERLLDYISCSLE